MKCTKCGKDISAEWKYCLTCGEPVEQQAQQPVMEYAKAAPVSGQAPKAASAKRNIIILIAVLALVVVGIIGTVIAVGVSQNSSIADTLQLAERYLDEQNYEQAIIEFEKILEIDPRNIDAYIGLAKTYIEIGDTDKAIDLLEEAYDLTEDEQIKALLDELTEAATETEDTPETLPNDAESSTIASTDNSAQEEEKEVIAIPTESPDLPYNDEYCREIELMLFDYFNKGGELNTEMLADVTELEMYGTYVISVSCDDAIGTEMDIKMESRYNDRSRFELHFRDDTELILPWGTLTDISFVKHMPSCSYLSITYNCISDISPVSEMYQLERLDLNDNNITDLSDLTSLDSLYYLSLGNNRISDISPLSSLTYLTDLYIYSNEIKDISAIADLTDLWCLGAWDNNISDISPLAECKKLDVLSIGDNQISDITALSGLTNLCYLYIQNNNIHDFSPIASLTGLEMLQAEGNPIPEGTIPEVPQNNTPSVDPITAEEAREMLTAYFNEGVQPDMERLKTATALYYDGMYISDMSIFAQMTNLEFLYISQCGISDISALANLTKLRALNIANNKVTDISALTNIATLESLTIDTNDIEDYSPIGEMTQLKHLTCAKEAIPYLSNLTKLEQLSITGSSRNSIDYSPLANLTRLFELRIYSADSNIDPAIFKDMTRMQFLDIYGGGFTDLSCFENMIQLESLHLTECEISDLSPLKGMKKLSRLTIDGGTVDDISVLGELTKLEYISLNGHNISDISPLTGLKKLESLDLSYNPVSDISHLANIKTLKSVDLLDTDITDISALFELTELTDAYLPETIAQEQKDQFMLLNPNCDVCWW